MPRITVVLPVYNHGRYVAASIESLLAQEYTDFKIVAVDDGSTDDSLNVLDQYSAFIEIHRTLHAGPARARNVALAACDSEFIAFMDADDLSAPSRFKIQVGEMDINNLDILASELSFVDDCGRPLPGAWRCPPQASNDFWGSLLERNWIGTPSVMLRRTALEVSGTFDEDFTHAEDYDLWLRISRQHRMGYVPAPLGRCRRHSANMSTNIDAHRAFERRALQKVSPVEARLAIQRLYKNDPARQEESWLWFLLRSDNPGFGLEVEKALQNYPDSRPIRFAYGVFKCERGFYEEAANLFRQLSTNDAASMNNFAVASAAKGDWKAAMASLEDAMRLRPDYYDARINVSALRDRRPLRLTHRPLRSDLVPML